MKCIAKTKFPNSNTYTNCGQCMPCRINRRREWMTKLQLEQKYYGDNVAFITLTYAPENLPEKEYFSGGSLLKADTQKFIKRFRKNYYYSYPDTPSGSIRYFLVGEYGSDTKRAHYHAILYGVDPERAKKITKLSWSLGHIQCGPVKDGGIQYVCGYTLKKLTSEKDFPDGQQPEFSLKSTQPALGHSQIPSIAKALRKNGIIPNTKAWHSFMMEQENVTYETFNGILGSKRHLRLDKPFLEKLLHYMQAGREKYIEELDEKYVIYPKTYKIRQSRLHDDSKNAKMMSIKDGTHETSRKKAEKIFRRAEENSKI